MVCCRSEIEVDVLGIESLAYERHVVFPADGGCEVDADTADGGADGTECAGAGLSPDKALGAGLFSRSFCY